MRLLRLPIACTAFAVFAVASVARAADLVVAPGTAIPTLTAAIARANGETGPRSGPSSGGRCQA